jgi:DNA-binding NarL/FixJ family response regulator
VKSIRVVLVDDHTLVRSGIRALLEKLPGVSVVAEASDGETAIELVQQHDPHVVLMDIAMPGMNGLDATAAIARVHPESRVIILSMYSNEEYVLRSVRCGAAGYLLKDAAIIELDLALKAVVRGETYFTPAASKQVVSDYVRRVGAEQNLLERLTRRQQEILRLIAEGRSTKSIAHSLGISIKTVEAHRSQLMDRLDIHDVAGLVRYAIRAGLVTPDE